MADNGRQLIEEITSQTDTSFSTRNRVVGDVQAKSVADDFRASIMTHLNNQNKNTGFFTAASGWYGQFNVGHGFFLRNMLKLRGRRNVLYIHNMMESSKDTDVETWQLASVPLNSTRVLGPFVSKKLGYDDLNVCPVFNGNDKNFVKAVADDVGVHSIQGTGQYRFGDNIVLSELPTGTDGNPLKFDCVYFYGIEKAEDRLYTIEEIREDFGDYITDNCQFWDYYETPEAREAGEFKLTTFDEAQRFSNTPRNNKTISDLAHRALLPTNDKTEAMQGIYGDNVMGGPVETLHRNIYEIASELSDRIMKVY